MWTSRNSEIASVDQSGNVIAKANGTTIITATTKNGKSASCNITVTTSITSLIVSPTSKTLKKDENVQLVAIKNPSTATEGIVWTSSNQSVATVNQNGLVTAKGFGTATITVRSSSGSKLATCQVEVLGVSMSDTKSYYDLKATERYESECIMEEYTDTCRKFVDCDKIWDYATGFWFENPNCRYEDYDCTKTRCSGKYEDVYKGIDDGEVTISFKLSSYVPVNNLTLVKNGISYVRVGSINVSNQSQAKYTIKLTTSDTYFRDGTLTLKYKDASIEYEIMTWNIRCR